MGGPNVFSAGDGELQEAAERAVAFHGHLGPYVVLGARMGLLAKKILGFEGHFDVKVRAYVGREPPVSCLADGLQVSTGATLGKGNIELEPTGDEPPRAAFESGRRRVTISLAPRALELAEGLEDRDAAAEAGRRALAMAEEELFTVVEGD